MTTTVQPRGMKKLYALGNKLAIDVSLSENPLGCSPLVSKALKNIELTLNEYPQANSSSLRQSLAVFFQCEPANIFVANGSEALIAQMPQVFASLEEDKNEVIVPQLSFPMFAITSELAGLKVVSAPMTKALGIDLDVMLTMITPQTKRIFICNPNNPTGSVISAAKLATFIAQVPPDVVVVIDEANIEFGGKSVVDLALNSPNVLVLRTFSKAFGLAGLRVGFVIGNKKLIALFEETVPIFPITGISEQLCALALADTEFIAQTKSFIEQQRMLVNIGLVNVGCTVFPSAANNLFVKLPDQVDVSQFWRKMTAAEISVVRGSSFNGFDDRFFRVSPRLAEVNQKFLQAVQSSLKDEIPLQ